MGAEGGMGPLLAEDATIHFPELVAPLLVATVAATAVERLAGATETPA
jgi:hypothetical protein